MGRDIFMAPVQRQYTILSEIEPLVKPMSKIDVGSRCDDKTDLRYEHGREFERSLRKINERFVDSFQWKDGGQQFRENVVRRSGNVNGRRRFLWPVENQTDGDQQASGNGCPGPNQASALSWNRRRFSRNDKWYLVRKTEFQLQGEHGFVVMPQSVVTPGHPTSQTGKRLAVVESTVNAGEEISFE